MTQDITLWSAGVRIFGKNKKAIEDMTIENFPATSKANAHAFAIRKGEEHLRALGLTENTGISIFFMEEHGKSEAKRATALAVVNGNSTKKEPHVSDKVRVKYKPFACPISTLCSERYLGVKENGVFNVVNVPQEK